jgi:hypothetical protein
MVELADTPDSNSGAAGREGSSPSPRTCECGLDLDAFTRSEHDAWHQIILWNRDTFRRAKEKKEKEFDSLLKKQSKGKMKTQKKYVPLP